MATPDCLRLDLNGSAIAGPIGSAKAMSESSRIRAEPLFASLNDVPQ
jgi:hypothetical protein